MWSGLNIALPAVNLEFQADAILLSWVVTSQPLVNGVFLLPCGRLADIFGIRKMFVTGLAIYTITTAIAIFSNSMIMLLVCWSFQGIGAAIVFGNSTALIAAAYPANERGKALGIFVASLYMGMSVGPFLGGILTEYLGWRSIFMVSIPAYLLTILLVLWKVKGEWAAARGEKFDITGSIIYGLALIALMYGLSLLPEILGAGLILAGIIGILLFLKFESRTHSPILNINVFRSNRMFLLSNLSALISYGATFAIIFIMSLYLQYIKDLTPTLAGLVLVTQLVIRAVLSPITGRLSDKIEPRLVTSAGMALTFIGVLTLSFLTGETSILYIIVALLITGAGFSLFITPNTNAVMTSAGAKFYGVAAASEGTMRSIGQMVSMGIVMVAMAVIIGRVVITPDYYPEFITSTRVAFGFFSALCFAGIFVSLARGKLK